METIQNNNTCNPVKRKLIPGLHLAMITNPSGGCGGSMFAWETYSTCISMGIPAILATFDQWHIYPEIGPALRRLSVPETSPQYHDTPPHLEDTADVCNEARAKNFFLIIDFKAGFSSDSSVLEVLKRSGIRDATSKAGLVPIQPGYPGASAIAVEAFWETGIYLDRGLFRYWDFTRYPIPPRVPKNPNFPVWNASWLSDGAVTLIHHARPIFSCPGCAMNKPQSTPMILSPQQQSVINELIPIAKIATSGIRSGMPFPPRTHSLIIGPSGGGKSFLASSIGTLLDLPAMIINVSSWVVLSAKNEPWTLSIICEFINKAPNGAVIVLDEADKGSNGLSDWSATIFCELLGLLDGVIPHATKLPIDMDDMSSWEIPLPNSPILVERDVLEKRLRERVFIVGCGAWQHAWRSNSRQIGFPMGESSIEPPSRDQVLSSMEPELRQRFRSKICWLPPMTHADYQTVSDSIVKSIPHPEVRRVWCALVDAAIDQAVADGLGMRVFEELMLAAMLQTTQPRESINAAPATLNLE